MKSHTALFVAAAALAVSACASVTPYAPAGQDGRYGYADQRISSDRYRVSFSGNSVTTRDQVETALLLRAAEVTLESGNDWFTTVERSTDRDVRLQSTPDLFQDRYSPFWGPSWRYYRRGAWSRWNDPFWGRQSFDVREVDRFEATAEIVVGSGRKPAGDVQALDAREVVSNIGGRVARAS